MLDNRLCRSPDNFKFRVVECLQFPNHLGLASISIDSDSSFPSLYSISSISFSLPGSSIVRPRSLP